MLIYITTGIKTFPFNGQREQVLKLKLEMSPSEVCKEAPFLITFAKHVYELEFEEEPNYSYLKFVLIKNLLDVNIVPSKTLDW